MAMLEENKKENSLNKRKKTSKTQELSLNDFDNANEIYLPTNSVKKTEVDFDEKTFKWKLILLLHKLRKTEDKLPVFLTQEINIKLPNLTIFLKDHFHLLFKSAEENHERIQGLKKESPILPIEVEIPEEYRLLYKRFKEVSEKRNSSQDTKNKIPASTRSDNCLSTRGGQDTKVKTTETNLQFHSFVHLKKYQKKVRIVTYGFSSTLAAIVIVALIIQLFSIGSSRAATFTWTQSSWDGGSSTDKANHNSNQTNWTKYSAKDSTTAAAAGGVSLTSTSASVTDNWNSKGSLTALSPATIATGSTPQSITISTDGTSMYTANQGAKNISMYGRNTSTGALTALSPAAIATGANPTSITISTDGTSVYVTNIMDFTVSMYSRNISTGVLTALSPATIATGSYPQDIAISADGTSAYVTNSGNATVSQYSRNVSTGALTALSPATIAAGSNPNGITISADGTSVYVANYISSTVSMYSRNTSTGALTALSPATIATGANPTNGITISADGTSVYVANYYGNSISMYSRNTSTGALTALSPATIASGLAQYSYPTSITISTDGTSVYAANSLDNSVSMYSRDTSTGVLTALATPTISTGQTPYSVIISTDGTSVYAANEVDNTISMYSRNTTSGPGFGAGTLSSTAISGSGAGATVGLANAGQAFAYTGSIASYTVPAGVTSAVITALGAGGGSTFGGGGAGGSSTGALAVTPGQTYYVAIGGTGSGATGGYGGGGTGGSGGAGGGGMTALWLSNYSTSASSVAIGTGSKTFTVQSSLSYVADNLVMIVDSADTSKWMSGLVTSYSGTTLVVNVTRTSGSGTIATWNVSPITIIAGGGGGGNGGNENNACPVSGGVGGGTGGGGGTTGCGGFGGSGGGATQSTSNGGNGSNGNGSFNGGGGGGGGYRGGGGGGGGWYQYYPDFYSGITGPGGAGGGGSGYVGSAGLTNTNTANGTGAAAGTNGSLSIIGYFSSGTFTSGIINAGAPSTFSTLAYSATLNSQTLTIDARAGDTINTADASWTAWATGIASGGSIASLSNHQYIQYRANLSTTDASVTPTLSSVTINYSQYNTSGTLTSSVYDSTSSTNTMGMMRWTEDLKTGTDIKFQMQTAPDSGGSPGAWSGFMGPDGTSGTYFTDPTGGEAIPAALTTGNNDEWFQYKAFLTSNGGATPTLTNVRTNYVVNATPEFDPTYGTNGVTVSQISTSTDPNWGKVKIDYSIRDVDTTSGSFTKNYVTPTFEYTLDGTNYSDVNLSNIIFAAAPTNGGYGTYMTKTTNKVSEGSYLTYTAYWDAKTQIPESASSTFHIRAKINDNEGANNIATAISTASTLDTKNPTPGTHPILIDGSVSTNNVTLSMSDNSSFQMKVGLVLSGDGLDITDASWETYSATKTKTLETNPDTVYVKFQDIYGNSSGTIYSITTPQYPAAMMVQDTSNVNPPTPIEPRLFIAWKVADNPPAGFNRYEIYRATNAAGPWTHDTQNIPDITSRTLNYYGDASVNSTSTYYYKVRVVDNNDNISYFSNTVYGVANGIQDGGEGGGGTDRTKPVIDTVHVSSINTTSAIVTWNTNEVSDSFIGYSQTPGPDSFAENIKGSSTMADKESGVGQHKVVLTNLDPNTNYYFQVTSEDPAGNQAEDNSGGPGFTFKTAPGPAISNIVVKTVSNYQATISWRTTTDSNTFVTYAKSLNEDGTMKEPIIQEGNPVKVGGTAPYIHEWTLTGLTEGTKYYFSVKSMEGNNEGDNVALDDNGGEFYELTTDLDKTAPHMDDDNIDAPVISHDKAVIYWTTDEPATSQVKYATHAGGPYTTADEISFMNLGHYAIVTGLDSNTKYYYKVISRDISNNSATSIEHSFTTLVDQEFNHDAIKKIEDIEVPIKNLSDKNAIVTFTTDQAALCLLELATSSGNYSNPVIAFENGYDNEINYNRSHAIRLLDLIPSTEYYFKLSCHDNIIADPEAEGADKFKNWVFILSADEENFTTLSKQIAESSVGTGDTTDPIISGVKVSSITGESATITWDTDENGSSSVGYGIESAKLNNMAGDYSINLNTTNYSKSHSVIIHGLIPATKYYFTAVSSDISGNIGESSESSFTTSAPSSLSSIKVTSQSLGEATITWKTDNKSTSVVEYGLTTSYGDKKENTSNTTDHSISLSKLDQGVTYHYRVKGTDENNNIYASADNTFEPKSPPKISTTNINDVTEHGAAITFTTNIPTDANITYTDTKNDKETGSQGIRELSTNHKITLINLKQGTTYKISISAKDEQGSEGKLEAPDFTTGKDENPPKIDNVHTDSALTQSDKVQTIISWKTDEQATSILSYREGRNGEEKEYKNTDNLSTNHVIVMTSFKSGTVYNFRVKSADASGNTAVSEYFSFLTPRMQQNIIQIITNNFMNIFGWTGNMGK